MADFDLSSCTATIRLEPHDECPERFFYIIGTVNHPTSGEIASLKGYLIASRFLWKQAGDFFEVLDGESDELMHLCTDIFDSNFNVRSSITDGGRRSGSGCWGKELNSGSVVDLEDITVKDGFRRRGVGSKLLAELWKCQDIFPTFSFGGSPHTYCWPSCRTAEDEKAAVAFFRKHGFRRVGLTPFLCYSTDPNHPSRKLAVSDDPDITPQPYPNPENMFPEVVEQVFPVHGAIMTKKGPEVVQIIDSAFRADPASIHKPGPQGLTPIHVAAEELNVDAIRKFLELGVTEDLKNTLNRSRTTPLEGLTDALRSQRQLDQAMYGKWNGYSNDEMAAEYLLKKASGVPVSPSSEEEYIAKRKLGCTCGQCTDGWLSPRMRHRIAVTAIVQYDTDTMSLDYIKRGASTEDYLSEIFTLEYIPDAPRRKFNKSFAKDFISMFRTIHDILEAPGAIPDTKHVTTKSATFVNAEYAIDAILAVAQEQSPLGDNSFEEAHGEDNEEFPSCDNDLAFELVRLKLGLDPRLKWGPYV